MFIEITVKGKEITINTNTITTYRAKEVEGEFKPIITFLPSQEVELELAGAPFNTEQACINAIESLIGGN